MTVQAAIRAKCLGCQGVEVRSEYETTASPNLIRIRCATCGAKRIASIAEGGVPGLTDKERAALRRDPRVPEPDVDLVAEARRIFELEEPSGEMVQATADAATDDASGMETMTDEGTIDAAYRAWLATADGATIAKSIRDRAFAMKDRGFDHYGIAALFEAARFDRDLDVGPDADGWKLNNNFRSRLARDLMTKYPDRLGGATWGYVALRWGGLWQPLGSIVVHGRPERRPWDRTPCGLLMFDDRSNRLIGVSGAIAKAIGRPCQRCARAR